ncbi:unnamed protein product, partial [Iphiclides podalirius]
MFNDVYVLVPGGSFAITSITVTPHPPPPPLCWKLKKERYYRQVDPFLMNAPKTKAKAPTRNALEDAEEHRFASRIHEYVEGEMRWKIPLHGSHNTHFRPPVSECGRPVLKVSAPVQAISCQRLSQRPRFSEA